MTGRLNARHEDEIREADTVGPGVMRKRMENGLVCVVLRRPLKPTELPC